jgi:Ethanolamine utilization protein EutJ (predicted chaperonin)
MLTSDIVVNTLTVSVTAEEQSMPVILVSSEASVVVRGGGTSSVSIIPKNKVQCAHSTTEYVGLLCASFARFQLNWIPVEGN